MPFFCNFAAIFFHSISEIIYTTKAFVNIICEVITMESTGIGLGDAMLMCQNGNGYNNGYNAMWNNPIWAMAFMSFMNGGFGGWNRNGFGGNGMLGAELEAAKSDIIRNTQAVNDNQSLEGQVRGIANGLSSLGFALNNTIKDGNAGVAKAVGDVGAAMGMGFCNTNHNIDSLKYENAKNTADIICNATANTQRIMDGICGLKMDAKDSQIQHLQGELADAKLNLSQVAQSAYLVEKLKA